MALTDEGGGSIPATMLVGPASVGNGGMGMPYPVPMYGMGGGQQGGNGGFGENSGWWIILLFIFLAAMGGNWGGNNNGGGGGFGSNAPIIVNDGGRSGGAVQRGFDQAAVMSGIGSIQSGVQGLSTQLCNCCCDMQNTVNQGFFGVQNSLCNGFNGVEQNANTRQIANMQQAFAAQTAMSQGFNQLGTQFADCCCEQRLATERLNYTIATENCADRYEAAQNTRDIIENANRNNQTILDKLCQLELDAKNDRIADLERQLTAANFSASQIAQTAQLERSNGDVIEGLYNRLVQCPVPSQPVYGSQPIFTCPNNNGCGCGCNGGNF